MEIVKGYFNPVNNCKEMSIQDIKDNLDDMTITTLTIDGALLVNGKRVVMCDMECPITFVDNFFYEKSLCVDEEYYKLHKIEIDNLFLYICLNTKGKKIKIDETVLINDELINNILNNPNLEEVILGSKNDVFVLTEELYEKFKKSNIRVVKTYGIVDSLKENFDPIIGYNTTRNLIGYDNYEGLVNAKVMYFSSPLTKEEKFYLKFINKKARIVFSYDNYENVFDSLRILRENGHIGEISIQIEDKNDLNNYIFKNITKLEYFDNIEIYQSGTIHSLSMYMKYEKKLLELILPAINLSPFEKYLYAYNVTKKFKKYKENEEDKTSARDLYQIFDNEFMVCVGFSKLLGDLLDKLGIENYDDSVTVEVGLDGIPKEEKPLPDFIYDEKTGELKELKTEGAGHARRKIHLVDPKYGIDGYYFADPTWDNDLIHDLYSYALMTEEEYISTDRYNYYSLTLGTRELFFVHSLEEFYLKINIFLNKNRKKTEKDVISSLIDTLKELDNEFYQQFINKYGKVDSSNRKLSKEEIQDMLLEIGERILQKTDNLVDGKTFKEGISVLYRDVYGLSEKELENKVNEIMEYNMKRHALCFPTRYKIDRDNNKMVLHNMYNKFDLDDEPKLGF